MAALPDRFGPFVVLNAVGAGGMGEVYRARDTRLNRDVAIKVLTTAAAADPERQRRFADEAQAASALNHPNILTVYDVGVHDGVPYLVSELVEGTTLRASLQRGPLTVREILEIGAQMADGLAAAHQGGIVHRDFKPENVMITADGRVKILDFGLARINAAAGVADAGVTVTHTEVIVGTVPYMSPEQARGSMVDYRTNQFSLGLTLFEMATGRQAFRAESSPQTLAAIIEDEPEPISKLNPRVPAPLRWVIERCLAKDARQRYESTTDLARELRTLRDRLPEFSTATEIAAPAGPAPRRRRRVLLGAGFGGAALAAATIVAVLVAGGSDGAPLDAYRYTPFATEAGYQSAPTWSPDGKTLAYVAAVDGVLQVFTRAVGSPLRAQVTHSRFDCQTPFWSPDGTRLYYISLARDRDGLWSISSVGGEADLVTENVADAAISPDGRTMALIRPGDNEDEGTNTLWLSSPPASPPAPYTRDGFGQRRFIDANIRFAPDGTKIGIWAIESDSAGQRGRRDGAGRRPHPVFWVVPMDGGAPRVAPSVTVDLPNYAAPFSWRPDSRHIVCALPRPRPGAHLWILDTEGPGARLLTAGAGFETDPAVSPDGARIASPFQDGNYDVFKLSIDRRGLEPVLTTSRNEMDPSWSPATSQMAFATDRAGQEEIWVRSASGDFERPLVTGSDFPDGDTYLLASPSFSPDGQRVAYYRESNATTRADAKGPGNRVWISPVAGGTPVSLANGPAEQDLPTWSPDGNWVAFSENLGSFTFGKWSLMKMRVGASGAPQVLMPDVAPLSPLSWSPDGAWIAYNSAAGLSLVSPDGKSRQALYEEPWMAFAWSEDSRRLIGLRLSDDSRHLTFTSLAIATRAETVYQADILPLPIAFRPVRGFARMSPTTFLTSIVHVSSDIWLLDGVAPRSALWQRLLPRLGSLR
jgi:Tol biopolymer transport system component